MKVFLIVYTLLLLLGIAGRFLYLYQDDYPRMVPRGKDILNIIFSVPFLCWAAILLFGGGK